MASKNPLIQKSNVLKHPLGGGQAGLSRELGLTCKTASMLQAWSFGIDPGLIWYFKSEGSLTNLVYDPAMQGIIIGMKGNNGTRDWSEIRYLGERCPPWDAAEGQASQITSLSLSPSRHLLVTELGGVYSASCINLGFGNGKDGGTFGDDIGQVGLLKHSPGESYWASAPNPYSRTARFAIATSNGSLLLSHCEGGRWCREVVKSNNEADESMAVDWLSPNVIVDGGKDGGLRLWDIRGGRERRERRIQHPSQINHARKLDENTIVVAGLKSQMCSYDLRFQSTLATPDQVTRPYNQFPAYENRDVGHLAAGFDIYGDVGAAVTDDGRILLWDVKCGIELKQSAWRTFRVTADAIHLQFTDGGSQGKGLRLLVAAGKGITELSW